MFYTKKSSALYYLFKKKILLFPIFTMVLTSQTLQLVLLSFFILAFQYSLNHKPLWNNGLLSFNFIYKLNLAFDSTVIIKEEKCEKNS